MAMRAFVTDLATPLMNRHMNPPSQSVHQPTHRPTKLVRYSLNTKYGGYTQPIALGRFDPLPPTSELDPTPNGGLLLLLMPPCTWLGIHRLGSNRCHPALASIDSTPASYYNLRVHRFRGLVMISRGGAPPPISTGCTPHPISTAGASPPISSCGALPPISTSSARAPMST
jgi:hypothetical protein